MKRRNKKKSRGLMSWVKYGLKKSKLASLGLRRLSKYVGKSHPKTGMFLNAGSKYAKMRGYGCGRMRGSGLRLAGNGLRLAGNGRRRRH